MIWADRRFRLGHGRAFALYVMAYTAGRGWIEALRIDTVEANDVFGLRLNVWTSIVLFLGAAVYFVVMGRLRPGREESVWRDGREPRGQRDSAGRRGATSGSDVRADEEAVDEDERAEPDEDPSRTRADRAAPPAGQVSLTFDEIVGRLG